MEKIIPVKVFAVLCGSSQQERPLVRTFHSSHFGEIPCEPESAIHFPAGIPGFEHLRRFTILGDPGHPELVFLQSLESAELCFLVAPVNLLRPDYQLQIEERIDRLRAQVEARMAAADDRRTGTESHLHQQRIHGNGPGAGEQPMTEEDREAAILRRVEPRFRGHAAMTRKVRPSHRGRKVPASLAEARDLIEWAAIRAAQAGPAEQRDRLRGVAQYRYPAAPG
jgi:hypothetical protein